MLFTPQTCASSGCGVLSFGVLAGRVATGHVQCSHGAIAKHYKVDPRTLGEPHAATIDHVIAATAGCMMGTFGGALEARKIDASEGRLTADVLGEVDEDEGVLVMRRIHAAQGPGAGPRNGGAGAWYIRDALSSLPYPAQRHPAYLFLYADAFDE